eukprot:snap_masked-scaffold_1-processed-gene-4.39-mRNA-1 protein AED:1.00 eAED:1.00 QI:0/-1/0/0/-1/1/1/0/85
MGSDGYCLFYDEYSSYSTSFMTILCFYVYEYWVDTHCEFHPIKASKITYSELDDSILELRKKKWNTCKNSSGESFLRKAIQHANE